MSLLSTIELPDLREPEAGADESIKDEAAVELGRRLRQVRLRLGLSLADVDTLTSGAIGAGTLGMYERGDRRISVGRLARVAAFYTIPVQSLFTGSYDVSDMAYPAGDLVRRVERLEGLRVHLPCLVDDEDARVQRLVRFTQAILRERRGKRHPGEVPLRRSDIFPVLALFGGSPAESIRALSAAGVAAGDHRILRVCRCFRPVH
jgi:transcriptional regulator with XRE-family HTH domain